MSQSPHGAKDAPAAAAAAGPELTLGDCIAIAVERQPSLRSVRASQDATLAGRQALENIGVVASLLSRDLPVRKQQADRGVLASSADIQRAHNEVVADATQLYYAAVLAGQQEGIAKEAVQRLTALVDIAREMLKNGVVAMTKPKLLEMEKNLSRAQVQLKTAQVGREKAMAALREIMAVQNCDFPFALKDRELPRMEQSKGITAELVLKLAMERRPELALAAAGVDAFRLEVYAQGLLHFRRAVPTLASASDIHSRPIPQANRGPRDYRPGAIVPEMPVQVVGTKADRVKRVLAYSHRADEVYEKSRNLVHLEAQTAYLTFDQATVALREAEARYLASKEQDDIAAKNPTLEPEKKQEAAVLNFISNAEYLNAAFDYLVELSNLERVTAGGIRPAFPDRWNFLSHSGG